MFSELLFYLLFETVQPSYFLLAQMIPQEITVTLESPAQVVHRGESIAPQILAQSVYSVDLDSGTPLFVHNIFERRPIASIAKLMTAMVVLDHHTDLEEVVTISRNAAGQEGSSMGLHAGERITVQNLLTGMLINSGNDAAVALAEFDAGSEAAFVNSLNAKADELGLLNTHFSNAKGFDEEGNYSTAFDTMQFAKAALQYRVIRETVSKKTAEVHAEDDRFTHKLESTNELLDNPHFRIIGLKTGHTPAAGQSFVSLMQTDSGKEVLTVLLDSPDRFRETKIVLDWILRNYAI